MSLVTLVFGSLLAGIGGIIAIYSREAVRKAHKQKSAAIRLRAYMMFWRSYLLENELGMLLVLADRLENKINSTYKSSGSQGVVDLKNELKDALKNTPIDVNSDAFLKTKENILNFSEKNIEHAIDSIDLLRQNIFDGKTFITDEEATLLGLGVSYYSVEYKMRVGSLLDTLKYLILQLHDQRSTSIK